MECCKFDLFRIVCRLAVNVHMSNGCCYWFCVCPGTPQCDLQQCALGTLTCYGVLFFDFQFATRMFCLSFFGEVLFQNLLMIVMCPVIFDGPDRMCSWCLPGETSLNSLLLFALMYQVRAAKCIVYGMHARDSMLRLYIFFGMAAVDVITSFQVLCFVAMSPTYKYVLAAHLISVSIACYRLGLMSFGALY